MSEKDTVSKKYLQDNARFADIFNYYLYGGKQIILPEQLRPVDTASLGSPYGRDGNGRSIQKYRDIIKIVSVMSDDHFTYMLLAAELQSETHYAMPPRIMLYDALKYSEQIEQIARSHKNNKDKPENDGELLSGFYKTDRLIPIITMTVI